MKYRSFRNTDFKPSVLGYGCMRLPTADGAPLSPDIVEAEAVEMIRYGIDNGINYIDTAYKYHSGASEHIVAKALKDGYRAKVKLATKSPLFLMTKAEQYDEILDDQLKKLETDFIDYYLFHNLNKGSWKFLMENELLSRAEKAQKAGKIGKICFSFHDKYELFEEIINAYDKWFFTQLQYNFIDTDVQAGTKGVKLAAQKGIDVVVMEPLKGGRLANPIPEVAALLKERGYEGKLVELSLKWLWRQPEVTLILSGMSTLEQVKDNLKYADGPYELSDAELALLAEIKEIYSRRVTVPCTNCSYCLPCPQGIGIPNVLNLYNEGAAYDYFKESCRMYTVQGKQASRCVECRECEAKCPQGIEISNWMKKADELLSR